MSEASPDDDHCEVDKTTMIEFARRSAVVAPSLKPVLDEHIADNDEILAHVYFGDVSRWVCAEVTESGRTPEVVRLLDLLETSYPTADVWVQNLIDVSFVEMVQDDPAVVRLFGPVLRSRVDPPYKLSS